MLLDNFPKIPWINLDKSVARRKYMESLLKWYGLQNMRIKAVDGTNYLNPEVKRYCMPNPKLSQAENACTCSHLLALQHFVTKMDDEKVIIFEDDVAFDFLNLIPFNWSNFENNLPKDYDVIQLAISTNNIVVDNTLIKTTPASKYYCSTAYLITRNAAIKILEKYFSRTRGKFLLSGHIYVTADAILADTGNTYSIPIFSYKTTDSTVHPNHLKTHARSRNQQLLLWKNFSENFKDEDLNTYFDTYVKN